MAVPPQPPLPPPPPPYINPLVVARGLLIQALGDADVEGTDTVNTAYAGYLAKIVVDMASDDLPPITPLERLYATYPD